LEGKLMSTLVIPPDIQAAPHQKKGGERIWARRIYLGFAVLFWVGVVVQAFFAGAGIFVGGSWMTAHIALGHLLSSPIPLIPLILLILSFVGRLQTADRWWCGLLLFLAAIQPVVLYLRGVQPLLAALHPVNALLLFVLPLYLIVRVRRNR
jgi:hypothetical protein